MLEILVCIYYLGRHFLPQPLGFFSLPLAGELAFKNDQSLIVYFWPISKNRGTKMLGWSQGEKLLHGKYWCVSNREHVINSENVRVWRPQELD